MKKFTSFQVGIGGKFAVKFKLEGILIETFLFQESWRAVNVGPVVARRFDLKHLTSTRKIAP